MYEQDEVNLARTTAYNVEEDLAHADQVSRVLLCVGQQCTDTVVEYGLHVGPSMHPDGLPEPAIKELGTAERRIAIVGRLCEGCGGGPYDRYEPVISFRAIGAL